MRFIDANAAVSRWLRPVNRTRKPESDGISNCRTEVVVCQPVNKILFYRARHVPPNMRYRFHSKKNNNTNKWALSIFL